MSVRSGSRSAPTPAPALIVPPLSPWSVLVVLGVAAIAHHGGLRGGFVFEDASSVLENESIRALWPPGPFSPPNEAGVGGRPLANFSFALNYAVSGLRPWSYLATNLALHLASALLLLGLVRRTLLQPLFRAPVRDLAGPIATVTATLWAVHPLATSAVHYVAQRTELLMACCYLLTLYAVARRAATGGKRWNWIAFVACAAGMASKEVMVTAPLVALLYDRTFLGGSWAKTFRERGGLFLSLAATWLLLARLVASSELSRRGVGFHLGIGWFDYALSQPGAVLKYLALALWPFPLVFDYGWPGPPHVAAGLVAALLCAGLLTGALVAFRRRPALGFIGLVVFAVLAPTSSFIPIVQQPVAESRLYLPLAAVLALMTTAGFSLLGRRALLPLAVALAALAAGTVQRHRTYHSEVALWADTAAKRPDSARAHGNLAAALLRADRPAEALVAAQSALRLRPSYLESQHNLAVALMRTGRTAEAITHYETVLAASPDSAAAHANFAEALQQSGRAADAITHLETALALVPGYPPAHNTMSVVLLPLGRAAEAAGHARSALMGVPDFPEAHYNLANALAQMGETTAAIESFRTALRHRPTFAKAYHNLGVVLLKSGKPDDAIAEFEAALRLDPNYEQARRYLDAARNPARP